MRTGHFTHFTAARLATLPLDSAPLHRSAMSPALPLISSGSTREPSIKPLHQLLYHQRINSRQPGRLERLDTAIERLRLGEFGTDESFEGDGVHRIAGGELARWRLSARKRLGGGEPEELTA